MKIGICQYDIAWEDKMKNKNTILALIQNAKDIKQIDWLIFPEMTLTGFSMHPKATTLLDEDVDFFRNISSSHEINISFGGVFNNENRLITLNSFGEKMSEYSKKHLFSLSGEDQVYSAGTNGVRFQLRDFTVVPAICYDLRFADMFSTGGERADVFVVIANWPNPRREHWTALLRARAIETQAYVVGVNRIGQSPHDTYSGDSTVFDPNGVVQLTAEGRAGIFTTTLERSRIIEQRKVLPIATDKVKGTKVSSYGV